MPTSKKTPRPKFKFKRHHPIGAVQAELDSEYLENCFVDTGDLSALRDLDNPRSLLVGRTGSGKTALLYWLKRDADHSIQVEPENLSIDYIANSNILQFFQEAGLNLDVVFRLLWRHVIVVELLKERFEIVDETSMQKFVRFITDLLQPDKAKQKAMEYLQTWGDSFWEETEYRVKEVVSNIESELSGTLSIGDEVVGGGASAAKRLSEEQRKEVVARGKRAVQKVQIKALGDVITVLSKHIFTDPQKKYFIIIDRLDENWASESIRYKLLRALIEEIRTFRSITSLKVVVAMRLDLVERVFHEAEGSGFQEEKYRDLIMPLAWGREHLYELAQKRINYLLKFKYTKQDVRFEDVFPGKVGRRKVFDYILDRTLYRPRDLITYINYVLEEAVGKSRITQDMIRSVEEQYSEDRVRSIVDEWVSIYPLIGIYLEVLYQRQDGFRIKSIEKDELEGLALRLIEKENYNEDPVGTAACSYLNGVISAADFRFEIIEILYCAGVVGLKKDSKGSKRWAFQEMVIRTAPSLKGDSRVYIHPMFWRRLSVVEK